MQATILSPNLHLGTALALFLVLVAAAGCTVVRPVTGEEAAETPPPLRVYDSELGRFVLNPEVLPPETRAILAPSTATEEAQPEPDPRGTEEDYLKYQAHLFARRVADPITTYFSDFPAIEVVQVQQVIDGDTFVTSSREKVRLIGIDTPEMGEPLADFATAFTRYFLEGKEVGLEYDVEKKDTYGRTLAYVYVDGFFLNRELVRAGLARAFPYGQNLKYAHLFHAAEEAVLAAGLGIWSPKRRAVIPTSPEDLAVPVTQEVISWKAAPQHIGQYRTVRGQIVETHTDPQAGIIFLNFHRDYRRHLTVIIWEKDWAKFPADPAEFYLGATVEVTGLIREYKGAPEIVVTSPEDIKVIEAGVNGAATEAA